MYQNNSSFGIVDKEIHIHLDSFDIFLVVSYCCLFITGVIGNLIVYYVFEIKRKKARTKTEMLICYLAMADLVACIVNSSMFIYWTITDFRQWPFEKVGCIILPSLTRMTVTYTIGIIMFITIDRYRRICHPFEKQLKQSELWIGMAIITFLSIIFELPTMVTKEIKQNGACDVKNNHDPLYLYTNISVRLLRDIGILLILGLTLRAIYNVLYSKERLSMLGSAINTKKSKKAIRMLSYMSVIFIILVYPREILQTVFMITEFRPEIKEDHAFHQINSSLKLILMGNSICNPFIYARLHGRFRRNLIHLWKQACCLRETAEQKILLNADSEADLARFATDATDSGFVKKFRLRRAEEARNRDTLQNTKSTTAM